MFLESYQQIPDKLNPETKQYETKILFKRSIQTFKLLMEGLQFLRSFLNPLLCLFEGTKTGTDTTVKRWKNPSRNQRLVLLSWCCYLSSNNSL